MKTGGKSPYFSPVGGANEAAHILSLMGGRAAIQGRNPAETNTFQNRGKEVSNMAVFRIEKTHDYTVMSNHHLRDRSLSLKAKGLLSLMLFLPEEPEQGNPAQLNTNRSSKEKSKKDLSSTEGSNPVQSIPPPPRARTGRDGTGCGSGRAIDGMAAGPYKFNVGGLRGAAEGGHQKLPIRLVWIADISRWPLSALT